MRPILDRLAEAAGAYLALGVDTLLFEIHAYANEVTGQVVEPKTKFAWVWGGSGADPFELEWLRDTP